MYSGLLWPYGRFVSLQILFLTFRLGAGEGL
jgi:hypothetical protein